MGLFDKYSDLLGKKEERKEADAKSAKKEDPKKEIVKELSKETIKTEQQAKNAKEEKRNDGSKKIFNPWMIFVKLFMLIEKDLKLLLRSKSSALIVLVGPIAMILLVGLAFNTSSLYNIRIATYSEGYSDLSNSIISGMQQQQYYIAKVNSTEICQQGVKFGDYHLCVIFPKDLKIGSQDNTVQIYVDQSRTNLAALISNSISEKVAAKSKELGIDLTTDIITVLDKTKTAIEDKLKLINKLISDNSNADIDVKNAEEKLNKIDLSLDLNEFNFTKVDESIDDINEKYNISLVMVKDLKNSVEDIKLGVTLINAKLTDAGTSRSNVVQDLEGTRKTLTSTLSDLNTLRTSLNSINSDIGTIKVTNAGLIVDPIKTNVNPITLENKHLSFLFPTMVVLIIMFISVLLSTTIVIREKLSLAYFRNFITPTSDIVYMIGTYLTNIVIIMVQIGILFAVSLYFFKEQLLNVAASLAIVILIIASVFILIGMIIGYLFKSEETSTLAAISLSSILLFFSNTILPLESLPDKFSKIVKYNPFVISESVVKKILLFNTDLSMVLNQLYILLSMIIILFVVALIAREITKRSI